MGKTIFKLIGNFQNKWKNNISIIMCNHFKQFATVNNKFLCFISKRETTVQAKSLNMF